MELSRPGPESSRVPGGGGSPPGQRLIPTTTDPAA